MSDTITTYNGLLSQKPSSPAPRAGEQRYLAWQQRKSAKGNDWIKVKNETSEYGGQLCEIISAERTDFQDAHGNVSFNVEFSPISGGNGRGAQPATAARTEAPNVSHPANPPANGIDETRKHLMQSCNLYNLCVKAVDIAIAPNVPEALRTSEWLQAAVASIWIEASSRRSTDGVNWWSFIEKMPSKPIRNHE